MKARIANTIPLKTPLQCPAAWEGLNGCALRSPVFEKRIHNASAAKIPISNAPRMTPAVVERRTSRYVSRNTIAAIRSTHTTHWPLQCQPMLVLKTSCIAHPNSR